MPNRTISFIPPKFLGYGAGLNVGKGEYLHEVYEIRVQTKSNFFNTPKKDVIQNPKMYKNTRTREKLGSKSVVCVCVYVMGS